MPRRQTHQGLKFPTENILTHTLWNFELTDFIFCAIISIVA